MMRTIVALVASLTPFITPAEAQDGRYEPTLEDAERIASEWSVMLLHPLYDEPYACSEHPFSTSMVPGDALGQDCQIMSGIDWRTNTGYMRFYEDNGENNLDWYGWQKPVLAPLAGTIREVHVLEAVNIPGLMTKELATSLSIVGEEGQRVVIAHLGDVSVAEGQEVSAGDELGTVGNNGRSRAPHIHIGAVDANGNPAQIRWNLATAALRTRAYLERIRSEQSTADEGVTRP